MKTETQKQIERLQAELDKLKVLAEGEHEPKEGEWWWADCEGVKNYLFLFDKKVCTGYKAKVFLLPSSESFICSGGIFDKLTRKATETEVLEALTKEAEKRGFKKGVRFKGAYSGDEFICNANYKLTDSNSFVDTNNGCIFDFDTLKWATIVEEEKIYIGENEVIFKNGAVEINGYNFSQNGIEALSKALPDLFGKILKIMEV